MLPLKPTQIALLDRWQRGFPLLERPYAVLAADIGIGEPEALAELRRLLDAGVISRVGATLRPNTAGASLLAAMCVAADRLDAVADIVNAEPGVNHNYEREHAFNLWFVVTGADRAATAAALDRIRAGSGLDVLELPLERSYHIDLGFPLAPRQDAAERRAAGPGARDAQIDATDRGLLRAIEHGLPLVSEPYHDIARGLGIAPREVIARLAGLIGQGVVTRLGLIVRHRMLGFGANAMAVWDVPDAEVDSIGVRLASEPCVTLCYRRPRRPPHWPYNLFCMVHGKERDAVEAHVRDLTRIGGLQARSHAVLFSRRCFRQRGPSLRAA